ncbi:Rv3212 family protein [Parasphingorhabdus pacifica]
MTDELGVAVVRPERRTKADLSAVALIAVAVLVGATVLWLRSDARATHSETTAAPPPAVGAPASVPGELGEIWRERSTATPTPVVTDSTVITGTGGEVVGRDPLTGDQRWRYARDIPLCTIGAEWNRAIAVHRKGSYCSEVTSLRGASGERGPQRNSDARPGTRLLSDGDYVTATGHETIESWRSDLVRTQQYGIPPDLKTPDNNMSRPGCEYGSTAVSEGRVALIEECEKDSGDRITVIKTNPDDDEKPEEVFSVGVGSEHASVVAVTHSHTAVLLRDRALVLLYDNSTASVRDQFTVAEGVGEEPADGVEPHAPQRLWTVNLRPVPGGSTDRTAHVLAEELDRLAPHLTKASILAELAETPPGEPYRVASLSEAEFKEVDGRLDDLDGISFGGVLYWYTGTATVALDAATLSPLWTVPDTLGPGALFGGELVIPVADGLAVHDRRTGAFRRLLPVERPDRTQPVSLTAVGEVLLEQRGDTLVALR